MRPSEFTNGCIVGLKVLKGSVSLCFGAEGGGNRLTFQSLSFTQFPVVSSRFHILILFIVKRVTVGATRHECLVRTVDRANRWPT